MVRTVRHPMENGEADCIHHGAYHDVFHGVRVRVRVLGELSQTMGRSIGFVVVPHGVPSVVSCHTCILSAMKRHGHHRVLNNIHALDYSVLHGVFHVVQPWSLMVHTSGLTVV